MKNVIFDGKDYYFFRSLNEGDKRDLENGVAGVRTDSIRHYERHGGWGKYNNNSPISLEQVYDKIRMRYRRDTRIISLTRDANVALTYHSEEPKYVLVKIEPERLKDILDAGEYIARSIEVAIIEVEKNLPRNSEIRGILSNIDKATTIDEIRQILKDVNPSMSTSTVNDRQYLDDKEQINMSRLNAKLKILEAHGFIGNIVENVPNSQLLATMGNAYTSSEYIHYGDIREGEVIHCPKVFLEMFSLLQQAEQNGVSSDVISRINKKILTLITNGYYLDEQNNTFTNGNGELAINRNNIRFLIQGYSSKEELREELSVERAFELTGNRISYKETNMQLRAIRSLSEIILKKKVLVEILESTFSEENIEAILNNTYCINPELVIKQNKRGHKLSNTVNLLITEYGSDLSAEDTKELLDRVDSLSTEELLGIYNNGIETKGIENLLISTRTKEERIKTKTARTVSTKYMAEAIIEGYDWRKTRSLTKEEKNTLSRSIMIPAISETELRSLYNSIQRMLVGKNKFKRDEIFAIIINIAIDGKLGETPYKDLLQMSNEDRINVLLENAESL